MRQRALVIVMMLWLPVVAVSLEWTEHTVDGDYSGARCVFASDVDGDGDIDMLGAAAFADTIKWWENVDGDGLNWDEHIMDEGNSGALCVYAIDMDDDGDNDVLTSGRIDNQIVWWENLNGDGLNWSEHLVGENFELAFSIFAADIDDDGDIDVLGASYETDDITWWKNVNGDGLTWTEHSVAVAFEGAHSVYATDVDGDGYIDVIGAGNLADNISWWENVDGDGLNWNQHTITTAFDGAHSVYAEDVDGDGDTDVLGAASVGHDITWWENVDGSGISWTEHTLDEDFLGASSVYATDMDDDGDVDVLGTAREDDDITWWENVDGDGLNWIDHPVDENFDSARSVFVADVDGDLDIDILGAAQHANDITWWEQTPDRIVVTLIPTSGVDLPAEGGTLTFDVNVVSTLPDTYPNVMFWSKVKLPSGNFYPQIQFQTTFTLLPYMNDTGSLSQDIPSYAPPGEYEMWGWVGFSPYAGPSFSDFFPFTKSVLTTIDEPVENWDSNGHFDPDEEADITGLPVVYEMKPAYPNPFNPSTAINIALPVAAELSVVVYNVTGQQVAELANGPFSAGNHTLNFNASNLASGLYFVQAQIPGQLIATQKVMLVR